MTHNPKVLTNIVDKNGKFTRVWKSIEVPGSAKSTDRLGNIQSMFVPIGTGAGESNFNGITIGSDGRAVLLSTRDKEGNVLPQDVILNVGEARALAFKLTEYPTEWGLPGTNTVEQFTDKLSAGWDGESFVIQEKGVATIRVDQSEVSHLAFVLGEHNKAANPMDSYVMTSGYVDIIESPVNDGETNNFAISLGRDSLLYTYSLDSGMFRDGHEMDTVTLHRESDSQNVNIQLSLSDDEFLAPEDEEFIEKLASTIKDVDPRFDISWDDEHFAILFNDKVECEESAEGNLEFYTSNVLHRYNEGDFVRLRNEVFSKVYQLL